MRDWILLVAGTVVGVVALTADLIGLGAFPGFGWKQAAALAVALVLVGMSAARIIQGERRRRP